MKGTLICLADIKKLLGQICCARKNGIWLTGRNADQDSIKAVSKVNSNLKGSLGLIKLIYFGLFVTYTSSPLAFLYTLL